MKREEKYVGRQTLETNKLQNYSWMIFLMTFIMIVTGQFDFRLILIQPRRNLNSHFQTPIIRSRVKETKGIENPLTFE